MPGRVGSYHSALHDPKPAGPVERIEIAHLGVAMRCDLLTEPLPEAYDAVAAFYMEPPWPAGFTRFNERVGVEDDRDYAALMGRVSDIISLGRPTFVILGWEALKHLPEPDSKKHAHLWPIGKATLATWHGEEPVSDYSLNIIREVLDRYGSLGDPMCGYGAVGREAFRAGKPFVISDYDPKAIGRIAVEAKGW